jgi:hypothetical protein
MVRRLIGREATPSAASAAADENPNQQSDCRDNSNRLPRLRAYVTIARLERLSRLALRLLGALGECFPGCRNRALNLGACATELRIRSIPDAANQILYVGNELVDLLADCCARLARRLACLTERTASVVRTGAIELIRCSSHVNVLLA